jgi:hypothetical protein
MADACDILHLALYGSLEEPRGIDASRWVEVDEALVERSLATAEAPLQTLATAMERRSDRGVLQRAPSRGPPAPRFEMLREFWRSSA